MAAFSKFHMILIVRRPEQEAAASMPSHLFAEVDSYIEPSRLLSDSLNLDIGIQRH